MAKSDRRRRKKAREDAFFEEHPELRPIPRPRAPKPTRKIPPFPSICGLSPEESKGYLEALLRIGEK